MPTPAPRVVNETRYVDVNNHIILPADKGAVKAKNISGYQFVNTTYQNGVATHIYITKR